MPWDRLFPPGIRRTGLPTYPFAREQYWVAGTGPVPAAGTAEVPASAGHAREVATDTLMLQACWTEQEITYQVAPPENVRHVAIFCDLPQGDGAQAAEQDIASRFQSHATRILTEIQHLIGSTAEDHVATHLEAFWENLKVGKDCITEIPEDRWPLEGFYHPDEEEAVVQGKSYCKWGGFLDHFADFDCLFFNISPREALNMDPQERLFVQACWAVLEDAGYTRAMLAERHGNRVGVFAGVTKTGFDLYGPQLWQQGEKFSPHTSFSSVANRVSYLFNLHGPSMPIDTMCSSSLTAIHEACEHLLRHECELAIADGVNLYLHPTSYTGLCNQRMLSVDGRCKSFGMGGNGYVPGEGVGVVLLRWGGRRERVRDP